MKTHVVLEATAKKKQDCSRYLSIYFNTKDYMWHGDFKKELKKVDCDLFIDWRNNNYYEN